MKGSIPGPVCLLVGVSEEDREFVTGVWPSRVRADPERRKRGDARTGRAARQAVTFVMN